MEQLVRLLGCLCRNAVTLASVTPAALLSLPFEFGLTLVFNQPKMTETFTQFLGCINET